MRGKVEKPWRGRSDQTKEVKKIDKPIDKRRKKNGTNKKDR